MEWGIYAVTPGAAIWRAGRVPSSSTSPPGSRSLGGENGGTIDVVCPAQGPSGAFDFDGAGELNGGTVTVNGSVVTAFNSGGGQRR